MTRPASQAAAVLDACVLYPPSLRDLLMWLATTGVYKPRLTEQIHAEWIHSVLADSLHVPRRSWTAPAA